uniref:Copine-3 n=1 Tax=Ditylenchus dipsaci TaxID=166011 RepID=A0A915E6U7_9BILA
MDYNGDGNLAPGTDLCTRVELMLSARALADKDLFSKSDPICIVYLQNSSPGASTNDSYVEVGRTETIKNCLNPQWNKKIYVNYYFEAKQPLRFDIYDIDSHSQALSQHDFLGRCECQLADIVAAPNGTINLQVRDASRQKGHLTVRADEVNEGQKETVYFVCHGRGLDKKDFFGKSDPFLEFYRIMPDGSRQLVHRTEKIKKTLNPEWKPFEITVRHLCEGNKDREFQIECYDYDYDGGHDLIGSCRASINALSLKRITDLPLINERRKRRKAKIRREFTFLEFIGSGLQLEFAVAIDFTASNGPVHTSSSLHYINSSYLNQYEMAISAVLEAIGFGAKIPPQGNVSHLFPLNLTSFDRSVQGVSGVLGAYKSALRQTHLNFPRDATRYQVLLIVTDGIITDMEKTKASIIAASDLPLSIIIIGVGNEDFEKMDELDADDELLTHNGRTAQRDIVQFVPFRNFLGAVSSANSQNGRPADQAYIQSLLAKEVLAEVPDQVTSYFKSRSIAPLQTPPSVPYAQQPASGPYPNIYTAQQPAGLDDINFRLQNNMNLQSSAPFEDSV